VVRLFTLEGGLLALVSSAVGLAVASIAIASINAAGISYSAGVASQPIPLTVSLLPEAVIAATIFLAGVAVLASLLPARRAARLAIADALGPRGCVMPEPRLRVPGRTPLGRHSMEKDVVCGMRVEPAKAAGASELNGKVYIFCSKGCKTKFDADPFRYAKETEP